MCLPTLPKIFRPVTRNTLIILFCLIKAQNILSRPISFDGSSCSLEMMFAEINIKTQFDQTQLESHNYGYKLANIKDIDQTAYVQSDQCH